MVSDMLPTRNLVHSLIGKYNNSLAKVAALYIFSS